MASTVQVHGARTIGVLVLCLSERFSPEGGQGEGGGKRIEGKRASRGRDGKAKKRKRVRERTAPLSFSPLRRAIPVGDVGGVGGGEDPHPLSGAARRQKERKGGRGGGELRKRGRQSARLDVGLWWGQRKRGVA